jgi:predicted acylesterase/phospholipase RssA
MSHTDPIPDSPPPRHCDVIMKGGITSGVVYPAAGVELAKRYTLKSIGGASAGAIAAAFFAAAEYRRSVLKSNAGFEELATYPERFGATTPAGTSFLLSLFQPAKEARRTFRLLLAFLGSDKWRKLFRVVRTAFLLYPIAFVFGFLPGAALAALAFTSVSNLPLRIFVLALAAGTLPLGGLFIPTLAVLFDLVRSATKHQYGLCPGRAEPTKDGDPPPLTDWIEQRLDEIAFGNSKSAERPDGYTPDDPLTFADLWGAKTEGDRRRLARDGAGRRINLEVMTTNLTQGRPYRLPFESQKLYFDPAELAPLFSPRVIEFMRRERRRTSTDRDSLVAIAEKRGLVPLPHPADLPVVFAVRLSLSFPILISAVPLWGFDFSYAARNAEGERGEPRLTRCWFSDGGLTSNFPIHFFDGPIPRWPTFAFNLTPFHPRFAYDPHDETKNVWLPRTNGDGQTENWSNPPEGGALASFLWFLGRIVDTMHNWRDNIQLKVPGYRDRIAQIHLRDEEGGLNLTMPPGLIQALSVRGAHAARVLAERFSDAPPPQTKLTWDNHCWVRLRSMMGLLEQQVARIERAFAGKEGMRSYDDLEASPPSYRFESPEAARVMLDELDRLAAAWAESPQGLSKGTPRPAPELRILPRV